MLPNGDNTTAVEQPQGSHNFSLAAIALIPAFDASPNGISVDEFIRILDDAASLSNWTDAQIATLARMRIQGQADLFLQSRTELKSKGWPELKKSLEQRFGNKETLTESRAKLHNCVQTQTESIREFATRLRVIGNKLLQYKDGTAQEEIEIREKIAQEEILSQFIRGLREDTRRFVATSNPQNLEDAITKAIREENYLQTLPTKIKAFVAKEPEGSGTPCSSKPRDGNNERKTIICKYCHYPNHIQRDCVLFQEDSGN